MSRDPIDDVFLPLPRRAISPNMIAAVVFGAQHMSTANSVFAMRVRTAFGLACCECDHEDNRVGPHVVEFEGASEDVFERRSEMTLWALQNLKRPFNDYKYRRVQEGGVPSTVWQWQFADPDEALHFKIRWTGVPTE